METADRVWREEVFGPVVCIRPFDDEAQMLREVNDSPYGLSGSIWTNDLKRALRVSRQSRAACSASTRHSSVHVEAPFGGFKQSGLGRDLGMAAMEGYTELKNIYVAVRELPEGRALVRFPRAAHSVHLTLSGYPGTQEQNISSVEFVMLALPFDTPIVQAT